ncbi:hypothetical protein [Rugamonas apoptosis]|uniref:Uncharacterized protein n=1 Tax=Rugamonas apoptosis TaxID=2758570 RepID=A0A7W2F7U7_9BURK|nr:hypothetical protein [Rugamonas apoptosis]MBA5686737.1 hypothetical protein [Rugamonas apoptosis]
MRATTALTTAGAPPCIRPDQPYSVLTEGPLVTRPATKSEINFSGICVPGVLVYSEEK